MRYFKHFLAVLMLIAIGVVPSLLMKNEDNYFLLFTITGLLVLFQLISFINRHNLKWKNFYTSSFNLLTAKKKESFDFDFNAVLLFEKAKEVLRDNKLSIESTDESNFLLLATTSISLRSWGENIYITVTEKGDNQAQLVYESIAFGIYSWGKNEDNSVNFKNQLEDSFII